MNPEIKDQLNYWQEEVHDCQKVLENDTKALHDAQKWVETSKLRYAEAIIRLHEFKKQHSV